MTDEDNETVDFDTYNDFCSACPDHEKCHPNKEIDYEKVAKCKAETLRLYAGKTEA